jgi:hypothetical protein
VYPAGSTVRAELWARSSGTRDFRVDYIDSDGASHIETFTADTSWQLFRTSDYDTGSGTDSQLRIVNRVAGDAGSIEIWEPVVVHVA